MLLNEVAVPEGMCLWKRWKDGRGLICVKDEETSEFMCKLINETKIKGNEFRAWHRGEFGEGRLVTAFLNGPAFQRTSGEDIVKLVFKQNKLPGRSTGVLTKDSTDGRLLRFFADKTLWEHLLSLRTSKTNRKIKLLLGVAPEKFILSKDKVSNSAPSIAKAKVDPPAPPVVASSTARTGDEEPSANAEEVPMEQSGETEDQNGKPSETPEDQNDSQNLAK